MFNRQYQKRRYETPKNFPTAVTFRLGNNQSVDFDVADMEAYDAFRRNIGQLDPAKIQSRHQELGNIPFTAKDFEQSLKDGAEFYGELANDGDPTTCGLCLQAFEPKVIPWVNKETGERGEGGNFLILKSIQIDDLTDKLKSRSELAEKVKAIVAETTATIMNGVELLSRAVALPVCKNCRESRKRLGGYVERYYSRATAREALPLVEQKIENAIKVGQIQRDAAEISVALGGRRQFHRPTGGGVGTERSDSGRYNRHDNRGGNGRQFERREDTRPRRQWPGPGGAELLTETADALDRHGYTGLEDALTAAKSGKLLDQGIVPSPNALAAVANILSYASQGQRQVVGDQQPSVIAPGASRPQSRRTARPSRPRVMINADPDSGSDSGKKTRRRNTGGTSPDEALA